MISLIRGILVEATPSAAVVDVSGVGFELGISGATAASLPALGEEVRLYTRFRTCLRRHGALRLRDAPRTAPCSTG